MPDPIYEHPYPTSEALARYPFEPLDHVRYTDAEMRERGTGLLAEMRRRRSVRMFSDEPVDRELIDTAIGTAATAPSGAHCQPWKFVITNDAAQKRRVRLAAEAEERTNYLGERMNDEWRDALGPLGTDHHKEFLEVAPWLVVLFEERYRIGADGERLHNYYVKESVGIAAGMFITALHHMGLATLPHTPSPMAFLSQVLERPENERPFALFPVGYPLDGVQVPDLSRKPLSDVLVRVGSTS